MGAMSFTSQDPRTSIKIPVLKNAARKSPLAIVTLALCLAVLTATTSAWAASTFNLLDARERGTTATGAAKGTLNATYDEGIKKDVLEFLIFQSRCCIRVIWIFLSQA